MDKKPTYKALEQRINELEKENINYRRMEDELRESEGRFRRLFEQSNDAAIIHQAGKIIDVNKKTCEMLGYSKEQLLTLSIPDLHLENDRPESIKRMNTFRSEKPMIFETQWVRADGTLVDVEISARVIDSDKRIIQGIGRNITDRKKTEEQIKASLREKEMLLGEIHHRVKNNMQAIISLLRLQSTNIKEKQHLVMVKELQDRIRSMALVHETLYQAKDFSKVDVKRYLKALANLLFRSYGIDPSRIRLQVEVEDLSLRIDSATPVGLLVNEIISNSLKYAFPESREGVIRIALHSINEDELELIVSDNGIGIPEDKDIEDTESFGQGLIKILAEEQLNGKMELDRTAGIKYQIRFKKKMYQPRI